MSIAPSVLMVELIMSADRIIQAAEKVEERESGYSLAESNEWGPQVILGHLSQVDDQVWLHRINVMVDAHDRKADVPTFVWWEPDPLETQRLFESFTVQEAGAELMATRTKVLTRLRDLTEDQWQASATHDTFGQISVTDLLLELLGHDEEHRGTLVARK